MNDKIASILLLAVVCLAGITLALVVAQPTPQTVSISSYYPAETNITNTEGATRTFNVTINQTVNASWLINGTEVFNQSGVNFSEYTNTSAVPGYWNVTAYAHNENGSDIRTWWWTVTEDTTPPTVISHAPTGTKISIKTDITATFNETVNPSTLNNATVIVCNSSGGTVTGIVTSDSETNTTVTFDPLRELEYNETYNVTITEGVQDLAGNNMSSDFSWNFTTRSEILITPIVIYGYVTYTEDAPSNVSVNITNLNTSENFTVKTTNNSNYYRMQTDSTNIGAGDMIRFNATNGANYNETVHTITEADIENGGLFMQNLTLVSEDPDLAISDWSREVVSFENETYTYNITYMVRNIGDVNASGSTTAIYIDGEEKATDPVPALASDVNHTSTVGPINSTPHNKSLVIEVCADGDNTVDERNEENNCLKKEFQINLEIETRETDYWVDTENGRFKIAYKVKNSGDAYVDASNTTINITNVMINGSVSNVTIKERVQALAPNEWYENSLGGPFTCLCNHTVNITACADSDNELLERKEGDNCQNATLNCRASACKPDLKIVNHTETWINRTDRSFNIAYTIKNIGNGNASNSTTRVHGKDDPVPKLAPGESNIRTVGPFNLTDKVKRCTEIKICADCNDTVSESNEDNNCLDEPYVFGVPWLITVPEWVDYKNKTYNITYKVTNLGGGRLNESTAYLYIDGIRTNVTDTVPELAKVPSCVKGEGGEYSNTVGLGPFTMTGTSDTFQVRLECDGSFTEGMLSSAACVADDGTAFRCGDHITKSCTFTGDMYCGIGLVYTGRRYPHGLFIDRDDITIDGNGSALMGDRDACACMYGGAEGDRYIAWTGITNPALGSIYPGYDNVTIKNLEVRNFCNGISIVNADNNRIENCSVHDNGATVQYNYGIYVENSNNITIDRCEAYNNTGILTDENVCGGHGINFEDDCNYCAVTNSNISHNYLSGILASPTCKYLYICNNLIEDNGYCNESGFCAGVNLHWKGGFGLTTNSTVENNVVLNNTGSGIYVTQGYTAIKNNTIRGSKNGTDVTGNGILVAGGSVTFLYNNTCCENEGTDIVNSVNSFATFGDDNTCDTTDNYDDDDSIGCSFYCGGVKGVCKGATKIFGCGDVVTESCTFNHSMSCRGCDVEYGLIVGAENVTIDGAGYKLSGIFTGIGIFSNYTGVTVKNLQVEDFSTGMKIENVSANIIENCIVCRNRGGQTGINFSADNGTVRNNRIYDNNGTGIFVSGTNNIFENNTISRNKNGTLPGYGIYFRADVENNNNNISANFIGDNEGIIDIYNSDGASYIGDNNTCDTTYHYNDTRTTMGCTHAWTTPDLVIANKSEDWVGNGSTDYRITYTVENIGKRKSREAGSSTTYLFIDVLPDEVAKNPVGPLKPGDNYTSTFSYIASRSGESDRIKVCADGADDVKENNEANNFYCNDIGCYWLEGFFKLKDNEVNNCLENVFNNESGDDISSIDPDAACVGWHTDKEYKCTHSVLNTVEESCTFNGNMGCPAGQGLIVGRDGITIDGNGHVIIMNGTASCTSESDCGILNSGYDNVKIKNLEVVRFCNGMYLTSSEGEEGYVYRNTIQNCIVRDNGASGEGGFHGIKMSNVYDSTIRGNIIKNTIAHVNPNPSCEDGGNGIFMYQCCDNDITEGNKIYGNKKGGIFMKMQSSSNNISYNDVYENGQGGIIVRCKSSNDNIIEHNEIRNNYGSGIFIGGNRNKVRSNTAVSANKDGGPYYADYVGGRGCGIKIGRAENEGCNNKLYNNTICRNDYLDVFVLGVVTGNTGADNLCDTTENYNDTDVTAGCRNPCPGTSPIDLMITSKSEYWEVEGSTYYINYTVKNNGSETAPESITDIWINDDLMEEYQDQVGQLGAGESVNKTVGPFTMNRTSDKIEVRADGGATVEKVEKYKGTRYNNGLENTWTALPDLTVTKIEVPDELSLFKSNTVTARIENIGTVKTDADEAFTVALFVDGSASPTDTAEVSGLGAGESIPVPLTWKPLIKKDYTLKVVVDWESGNPEGAIHESDEMNNEKIIEITEKTVDVHDYTHGGPKPPPGEENITGYEPGPGEGTGVFGKDTGTKGQINESSVSGEEKWKKGNPFYGMGGEVIETVKVVAPVFLIIMVIIMIALFYSGYYKEKRGHRRNFRREK